MDENKDSQSTLSTDPGASNISPSLSVQPTDLTINTRPVSQVQPNVNTTPQLEAQPQQQAPTSDTYYTPQPTVSSSVTQPISTLSNPASTLPQEPTLNSESVITNTLAPAPRASITRNKLQLMRWGIFGVGLMIVVLLGLSALVVYKNNHKVTITPTISYKSQTSTGGYTQSPENISRNQDAAVIESTISNYIDNNSGELPQSTTVGSSPDILDICGEPCSNGDVEPTGLTLSVYSPSAVSFQPYASGLTVPDSKTLYIIDKASCNDSGTSLTPPTSAVSVAVLYALQNSSKIEPICREV